MSILKLLTRINVRCYCSKNNKAIMKYLNVAEKNDAAKNIAGFLSRGTARRVCCYMYTEFSTAVVHL